MPRLSQKGLSAIRSTLIIVVKLCHTTYNHSVKNNPTGALYFFQRWYLIENQFIANALRNVRVNLII
jgi:hypothetical protein